MLKTRTDLKFADGIVSKLTGDVKQRSARRSLVAQRYGLSFASFVTDILGVENPSGYQIEIGETLLREHRLAVRGPHGIGKTATAAWIVLYFMYAFERDVKVITTASNWTQLSKYLWPEINKWAQSVNWALYGLPLRQGKELLSQTITIPQEVKMAFAVSPGGHRATGIEGAHADTLLYLFDEAKAIPDAIWDSAEGAFASGDAYAFAISTPGNMAGRFWQICTKKPGFEHWATRHVTKEEAREAGRMTDQWISDMKRQWRNRPDLWANRVEGEFYATSEDALIPSDWVDKANQRFEALKEAGVVKAEAQANVFWGLDIGEMGDDLTCLTKMTGHIMQGQKTWSKNATMKTTGLVQVAMKHDKRSTIVGDGAGVGAGVCSRLKELGYQMRAIKVGRGVKARSRDGNHFVNLRCYVYWRLRERLDPEDDNPLAIPYDDELYQELTAPTWEPRSNGAIWVSDKDEMKKILGRSPDKMESLMFAVLAQEVKPSTPIIV